MFLNSGALQIQILIRNVDTNSQAGNVSFAGPSFQTPQAKTFTAGIQFTF